MITMLTGSVISVNPHRIADSQARVLVRSPSLNTIPHDAFATHTSTISPGGEGLFKGQGTTLAATDDLGAGV